MICPSRSFPPGQDGSVDTACDREWAGDAVLWCHHAGNLHLWLCHHGHDSGGRARTARRSIRRRFRHALLFPKETGETGVFGMKTRPNDDRCRNLVLLKCIFVFWCSVINISIPTYSHCPFYVNHPLKCGVH